MASAINMRFVLLGLAVVGVAVTLPARAGDGYVIAHPGVSLTSVELRDMYLGEKQFAASLRLTPIDNSAAQSEFLSKFIKMDVGKYTLLWTKKGFRAGLAAPLVKSSDAEIISYVKNTVGAVGYISTSPPPEVTLLYRY